MIILKHIHPENFNDGTGYMIPAGKYWLGDPSYFLNKKLYEALIEAKFSENEDFCAGYFDNQVMVAMRTAYGDGMYHDDENNIYDVDSGMIGLFPAYFRDDFSNINNGRFVEFNQPVLFRKDNASTFKLGINGNNIRIVTDVESSPF